MRADEAFMLLWKINPIICNGFDSLDDLSARQLMAALIAEEKRTGGSSRACRFRDWAIDGDGWRKWRREENQDPSRSKMPTGTLREEIIEDMAALVDEADLRPGAYGELYRILRALRVEFPDTEDESE